MTMYFGLNMNILVVEKMLQKLLSSFANKCKHRIIMRSFCMDNTYKMISGGSIRGLAMNTHPSFYPNSFILMQFWAKILPSNRLANRPQGWRSPLGNPGFVTFNTFKLIPWFFEWLLVNVTNSCSLSYLISRDRVFWINSTGSSVRDH